MTKEHRKGALSRRQLMGWAASGLAAAWLPLAGWADDDDDHDDHKSGSGSGSSATIALADTGLTGLKVVVVGGGMAGMTAAKYLRLWGGSGVQVTLVDPDALYTSNIMSNLVLNGSRDIASLQFARDALTSKYGVIRQAGSVAALDAGARTVTLADGTTLGYDRLVLAPGVSFDDAYGLTQADYDTRRPRCCAARWLRCATARSS